MSPAQMREMLANLKKRKCVDGPLALLLRGMIDAIEEAGQPRGAIRAEFFTSNEHEARAKHDMDIGAKF